LCCVSIILCCVSTICVVFHKIDLCSKNSVVFQELFVVFADMGHRTLA